MGDPSNLEDYKVGRTCDDLHKFAEENLKPMCSPTNIDLCDDDKKAEIKKFQDMGSEELEKKSLRRKRKWKKPKLISRMKLVNFKTLIKSSTTIRKPNWKKSRNLVLVS